jgi:hypothetical protein
MNPTRRIEILIVAAALAASSAACKARLKGEIAVPGNDVRAIAVRIVPEKEIAAYLDAKVPKALAELDDRRRAFESSGRAADAAVRDYQLAHSGINAVTSNQNGVSITADQDVAQGGQTYRYDPTKHTAAEAERLARANLEEADRQRTANATEFRADKTRLAEAISSGRASQEDARAWLRSWETDMLADMPEKGIVVYTDEKGRFTAQVVPGKFAVFASGDFKIGGEPQHRAWGLWVKLTGADKTLILNPNNMLLDQPSDSVLR